MQQVKKTGDYTIYKKKSGRYAVKGKDKQFVHGEDKARILLGESLIEPPRPKGPAPEPAAEADAAETAADAPAAS